MAKKNYFRKGLRLLDGFRFGVPRFLRQQSRTKILLIGLLGIAGVGAVNYLYGSCLSFASLSLAPIVLVTWFAGYRWALYLSAIALGMTLSVDYTSARMCGHLYQHLWNETVLFGAFILIAYLISRLKHYLGLERSQARIDHLTGVPNRLAFYEAANSEIIRAIRWRRPLSVAFLDIDNFKKINDNLGHHEGDRLLRQTAHIIRENLRGSDYISRLGGDEFVILLPETDAYMAERVVEKIRGNLFHIIENYNRAIGYSIGVVTFKEPPPSVDEMLKQADQAMYEIKKSVKRTVEVALTEEGVRV